MYVTPLLWFPTTDLHSMDVSLPVATDIAKEAYIFFQPVVDQYQLKLQFKLPPNSLVPFTTQPDPTGANTTPYQCPDQFYSIAFLDLRKEPIVIYNPPVETDRLYSIMAVDHFEHNFAYFGSRATSNDEANYMIAGPDWNGTVPDSIDASETSEINYVTLIIRMKVNVESADDRTVVENLLGRFTLTPLSVYNGGKETPPLPNPDFPPYKADQQERAGFFNYVNAFTAFAEIYPTEQDLYTRFARIGVIPGVPFPPMGMSSTMVEAIEQGIWEGSTAINSEMQRPKGANFQGWGYVVDPPMNGNRTDMNQRYLARAATARSTFEWGNSIEEATYMKALTDGGNGEALHGANNYTLQWTATQIPKVHTMGFWSITMYDTCGKYVEHNFNRYAIGSQSSLKYGPGGSVTIYIQNKSPGVDKESNWLPCPEENFQLFMRIYWPDDELLTGNYASHIPPGAKIRA